MFSEEIKDLYPGLGFFGASPALMLRVQVTTAICGIRLSLQSVQPTFLNLQRLELHRSGCRLLPDDLPKYTESISTCHPNVTSNLGLLQGVSIHSASENKPSWQVIFDSKLEIDAICIANRHDTWASRSRFLIVEILDENNNWIVLHKNSNDFSIIKNSLLLMQFICKEKNFDAISVDSDVEEFRNSMVDNVAVKLLTMSQLEILNQDWILILSLVDLWGKKSISLSENELIIVAAFVCAGLKIGNDSYHLYLSSVLSSDFELSRLINCINKNYFHDSEKVFFEQNKLKIKKSVSGEIVDHFLSSMFDLQVVGYKTEIAGLTNSKFEQHTSVNELICTKVLDVFEKLNLEYYLFAGSLVGYVRDKQVPPWMDDLDVLIFEDQINYFEVEVVPFLRQLGYILVKPKFYPEGGYHILAMQLDESRKSKIKYSEDVSVTIPWAQVDVFFSFVDANGMIRNKSSWGLYHTKDVPVSWVKPGRIVQIMGGSYRVFSEYEKDIVKEYGDVHNNLVVASHDKTFLRLPGVSWVDLKKELLNFYSKSSMFPPSYNIEKIKNLQYKNGSIFDDDCDSFDKICKKIIEMDPEFFIISKGENFFWSVDLNKIFSGVKLVAKINELSHVTRVTLLNECYFKIYSDIPEVQDLVLKQLMAISKLKGSAFQPNVFGADAVVS